MSVYGYCRVSTSRQASEGDSLEFQRRQIEGYAMMHGFDIAEIAIEEGVSGSVPIGKRPKGAELFGRLADGDIVIAAKLDRLFRSALDALTVVEDLKKRGVRLHLLDLGGDIAGNGLSRLFLTIAAAFAEAERDRIRERVSQSKADQKKRGRYLGGKVPFGFRKGKTRDDPLIPNCEEQNYIAVLRARADAGVSLRSIAAMARGDGFPISHEGVRIALRNQA
jgi:putative DNA-invertase from lambdoid prophage Rac